MTMTRPLSGLFVITRLEHAMVSLYTYLEVSIFTLYEDKKLTQQNWKWGGLWQLGVM